MTASFALSARPPATAIAWATKDGLFVELPTKSGPPYICRYRRTVEGLAEALNILVEHSEASPRSVPTTHPAITRPPPPSRAPWATEDQRAKARDILKRLKIVG